MERLWERQKDILGIIENLDISPTMYENADVKYHALASYLGDNGVDADIYPQGSFALGTVVRPVVKDPEAAYDLDFICQVRQTREQVTPSGLRGMIEGVLKSGDRYADKLKVDNNCITVEYADVGEVGFAIDVVPAAEESYARKQRLKEKSERPELLDTAIAIPRHNGNRDYDWLTNNPRGFRVWFEEVNRPFSEFDYEDRRKKFFEKNRQIFATVEEIPDGLMRSALQRVIQILKYHRDVYYSNLSRRESGDLKPISAIINVVVAEIARFADAKLNTFELLKFVLDELDIYAERQNLTDEDFGKRFGERAVIGRSKDGRRWIIQNPADPEDNLADKWNDDDRISEYFFRWIKACREDLVESFGLPNGEFRTAIENAFGRSLVEKFWGDKYKSGIGAEPIMTYPRPFSR